MAVPPISEPSVLSEADLTVGSRVIRITIEHGRVEAASGDLLALKYAQASYGVDEAVLAMVRRDVPNIVDELPQPDRWVATSAPAELRVSTVLFVGTPPLTRFGYSAVRAWATNTIEAIGRSGLSVGTLIATLHGLQIGGGGSLDEVRSLHEQIAGFREGLARSGAAPDLSVIRIIELDGQRANRISDALRVAVQEDRGTRPITDGDISGSVSDVRDTLIPDATVTASALAAGVQRIHQEYAQKRFGAVEFDIDAGKRDQVDHWLEQVVRLYPAVRRGDARLDGRRLVAGLSVLDSNVREALKPGDVGQLLLGEMDESPIEPPEREHVGWSPDQPTDVDRLGRRLVAKALADQLVEYDDEHSGSTFMFMIDGPWGSGKSTLLRFLRTDLDGRTAAERRGPDQRAFVISEFDAWRQSKAGPPWLLLMTNLRRALRRDDEIGRAGAVVERVRRVGRINLISLAAVVAVLTALVILWASEISGPGRTTSAIVAGLAFLAAIWPAARAVGRLAAIDTPLGAQRFVQTHRDPMEDVARHFAWLRSRTEKPIVLLIDDLDRCAPAYVVDLLDSVQKLVRAQPVDEALPTLFVGVAADGRWLREAYQTQYAMLGDAISEPGRPLGSLFLDKLFQLRVPVPELSPSSQETFLRRLLDSEATPDAGRALRIEAAREQIGRVQSTEVIDALEAIDPDLRAEVAEAAFERLQSDGVSAEARHALERFAPLLEPNPRSVLRFTMAFSILRAVRTAEGNVVRTDELALWTVVSTRWPLLAEFLGREPDAVSLFRAPRDVLAVSVPGDLVDVFANPSDDMKRVFNNPVGGPLQPTVIRQCVGIA